jgi:hypothetical protein
LNSTFAAVLITNSLISCQLPVITVGSDIAVSIGSLFEPWSNTLTIAVVDLEGLSVSPSRGSVRGGTLVTIHIAAATSLTLPACKFGNALVVGEIGLDGLLSCLTPPAVLPGIIALEIVDAALPVGSAAFGSSFFTYELTAEVVAIYPQFVTKGSSSDLLVEVIFYFSIQTNI